ncbi:TOG array regulator of axonemal microtubules 1 [Pelobates cultripes]|uniref:TOG array regulator of axonemal microtubules 1 n=1 Tax=Pelobates cultripes TaxID=61616 RepID=A0AAD1SNX3_PELCU|nr:TOG array regulator of axonemal microtubules 1 [Pelobates cultripes]
MNRKPCFKHKPLGEIPLEVSPLKGKPFTNTEMPKPDFIIMCKKICDPLVQEAKIISTTNSSTSIKDLHHPLPPLSSSLHDEMGTSLKKSVHIMEKGTGNGLKRNKMNFPCNKYTKPVCKESELFVVAVGLIPSPPEKPPRRGASNPRICKTRVLEQSVPPKPFNSIVPEALESINSDKWQIKVAGLNDIQQLAATHPLLLKPHVNSIREAVNREVLSLIPVVSKAAIQCMESLFCHLTSCMLENLDQCLMGLLLKAGRPGSVLHHKVDMAILKALENITPERLLCNFPSIVLSNRNNAVRVYAAKFLRILVERVGLDQILFGAWDAQKKVLPALVTLVKDNDLDVKHHGLKMLCELQRKTGFLNIMEKYVSQANMAVVCDIISKKHSKRQTTKQQGIR